MGALRVKIVFKIRPQGFRRGIWRGAIDKYRSIGPLTGFSFSILFRDPPLLKPGSRSTSGPRRGEGVVEGVKEGAGERRRPDRSHIFV